MVNTVETVVWKAGIISALRVYSHVETGSKISSYTVL